MYFEPHNLAAGFDNIIGLDSNKPLGSKRSKHAKSQRMPSVYDKIEGVASKVVGDARNGRVCLNYIFKGYYLSHLPRKYLT